MRFGPQAFVDGVPRAKRRLMSEELLTLRECLIGSASLIALINAGYSVDGFHNLLSFKECSCHQLEPLQLLNKYVVEAAFGDMALRYAGSGGKGYPMPVALVPNEPVSNSFKSLLDASKPDWKPFWDYLERERKDGRFVDDPNWAEKDEFGRQMTTRVQTALDGLNTRFLNLINSHFFDGAFWFPSVDPLLTLPIAHIEKALSKVKPLAREAPSGKPTAGYLELLRKTGAGVRKALAGFARDEGNAALKLAMSKKGVERDAACATALAKYVTAASESEEAPVANCNAAAILLLQKRNDEAIGKTEAVLAALKRKGNEPRNYTGKRAALVAVLSRGEFATLRGLESPRQPINEVAVEARLRSKTLIRNARAHGNVAKHIFASGNLYDDFFGKGSTQEEALRHAVEARESFQLAADLGFNTAEIIKEMKKLQKDVDTHLREHGDLSFDFGGRDDDDDEDEDDKDEENGVDPAGFPGPGNGNGSGRLGDDLLVF